jgi:hypothetical protein
MIFQLRYCQNKIALGQGFSPTPFRSNLNLFSRKWKAASIFPMDETSIFFENEVRPECSFKMEDYLHVFQMDGNLSFEWKMTSNIL